MDLEGITLSEISQTGKDKYCMFSFIGGILKSQTRRNRVKWWLPEAERLGNWGDVGQRIQIPSCKMGN